MADRLPARDTTRGRAAATGSKRLPARGSTLSAKERKAVESWGKGNVLDRFGQDLQDAAVGSAVGGGKILQALGKDVYHGRGVAGLPTKVVTLGKVGDNQRSELDKTAEALLKGTAQSFKDTAQHPLRHPGDTALNLLTVASLGAGSVSRLSNAGKALSAGDKAAAAKALLTPARETRFVKYVNPLTGKVEKQLVRGSYSRSTLSRTAQKAVDKSREKGAAKGSARATARNNKQFGKVNVRNARVQYDLATVPAQQLKALDSRSFWGRHKISDPKEAAVRSVWEQTHPDLYIKYFQKQIEAIKDIPSKRGEVRDLKRSINIFQQAKRYVNPDPLDASIPVLADPKLQRFLDKGAEVSNKRTEELLARGDITPEQAAFRAAAPGRILRGAEFYTAEQFKAEMTAAKNAAQEIASSAKSARKDSLKEFYRQVDNATSRESKAFKYATTRGPEERSALAGEKDLAKALDGALTEEDIGALAAARKMVEDAEKARDAAAAELKSAAGVARVNAEDMWKLADEAIRKGAEDAAAVLARAESKASDVGRLFGAEHFSAEAYPGLVRVPFKWSTRDILASTMKGTGQGGMVGLQRAPGTVTNSYRGGILAKGGGSLRLGKILSKDAIEQIRFHNSEDFRNIIRSIGSDDPIAFPPGTELAAVRLERSAQFTDQMRDFLIKHEDRTVLTKAEKREFERLAQAEFDDVFPKVAVPAPQPGIKWVPRSTLGGIDRAKPAAVESPVFKQVLSGFDTLNNAQKFAILYAKLGYIVPNLIGNVALNMIQQGPFMPRNLYRAAKLVKSDPELAAAIKAMMGEGVFTSTFSGIGPGKASAAVVSKASGLYGKVTDLPFRYSSFIHEAHVRGFKTQAQLKQLLEDPKLKDKLTEVVVEANADIIDYGKLGPIEKAWIRRIVFLYPWIKGSTTYAARFLKEHPIQAGIANQVGNYGSAEQQSALGDLPSFLGGLVPIGGTDQNPRVMNVGGITPFSTPFQTGQALLSPTGAAAGELTSMATPALSTFLTLATGRNRFGYDPRGESSGKTALTSQYKSLPAYLLYQRLSGQKDNNSADLYQRSQTDALLNFLLGSGAPATLNKAKANQYAREGR